MPSHDFYYTGLAMVFLLPVLNSLVLRGHGVSKLSRRCLDSEREALTTFRKTLMDPSNLLSSWDWDGNDDDVASDCCKWRGVSCDSNNTGHVIMLDLHGERYHYLFDFDLGNPAWRLSGRIHPALLELKHLQFLDLSYNAFNGVPIPEFLGSMKELRHLNLSMAGFRGRIPHQLGNLSNLVSLRLRGNYVSFEEPSIYLSAENIWWVTNMTFLEYLDMSHVNLSLASHDWVHVMNLCPSLVKLRLKLSGLSYISPTLSFVNLTSLRVLNLFKNDFNSTIPNWISNITSLVSLDLSSNNFHGPVPYQFSKLPNLEELSLGSIDDNLTPDWSKLLGGTWSKLKRLDLSFSHLHGGIPECIGNITSLVDLDLSFSENITGSIPRTITELASLESLSLFGYNMIGDIPNGIDKLKNLSHLSLSSIPRTGSIPAPLARLSSLKYLDLSWNGLNGTIPETLGGLSSLEHLDLSHNQLNGTISEYLGGLSPLKTLDLSHNHLNGTIPKSLGGLSSLDYLDLSYNQLNGIIPTALGQLVNLTLFDISSNCLTGTVPTWILDLVHGLKILDLSHNMFSGQLSNPLKAWSNLQVLDLSFNQLDGPIPPNFIAPDLLFFSISNNQINGTIPSYTREMVKLVVLDLSQNKIGGTIPSTLGNYEHLQALDLSSNNLSGGIPMSLGSLIELKTLHLNNNSLYGKLTFSLKNCTSLETLDVSDNIFSGNVPSWVGKSFPHMRNLRLRSNFFTGELPQELAQLAELQVLDAAENGLSGSIPQAFENLTAMKTQQIPSLSLQYGFYYEENLFVSAKGQVREYTRTISLVTSMDLSSNNLSGEIPEGLTSLLGLRFLNLSRNHLSGRIPNQIGRLGLMESLDLSENQLSGSIPESMSNLTFLDHLNLSHNKLSGKIPYGHQLQTLDNSSYFNNSGLCGSPLTEKCVGDKAFEGPITAGDDEENEMFWFYVALAFGFPTGFWAFCGMLLLKKSWRIAYFCFFDETKDKLFVTTALLVARLKEFKRSLSHE